MRVIQVVNGNDNALICLRLARLSQIRILVGFILCRFAWRSNSPADSSAADVAALALARFAIITRPTRLDRWRHLHGDGDGAMRRPYAYLDCLINRHLPINARYNRAHLLAIKRFITVDITPVKITK